MAAGPGSRLDRLGTIFQKTRDLIRSGALTPENKPVWYDVVAAFPPIREPHYQQKQENIHNERNLLYPEDNLRAKFYQTFRQGEVVDLTDEETQTVSQRFIEEHSELERDGVVPINKLFDVTVDTMKEKGYQLKYRSRPQDEVGKWERKVQPKRDHEAIDLSNMRLSDMIKDAIKHQENTSSPGNDDDNEPR